MGLRDRIERLRTSLLKIVGRDGVKGFADRDNLRKFADEQNLREFAAKARGAAGRAQDAIAANEQQIHDAISKAGAVVNDGTGGRYEQRIEQATSRAAAAVSRLKKPDAGSGTGGAE